MHAMAEGLPDTSCVSLSWERRSTPHNPGDQVSSRGLHQPWPRPGTLGHHCGRTPADLPSPALFLWPPYLTSIILTCRNFSIFNGIATCLGWGPWRSFAESVKGLGDEQAGGGGRRPRGLQHQSGKCVHGLLGLASAPPTGWGWPSKSTSCLQTGPHVSAEGKGACVSHFRCNAPQHDS